jgi:hypothetical protein
MYEFPKDDTNAPKQAAILEDHTLKCDCYCALCWLLKINITQNTQTE